MYTYIYFIDGILTEKQTRRRSDLFNVAALMLKIKEKTFFKQKDSHKIKAYISLIVRYFRSIFYDTKK